MPGSYSRWGFVIAQPDDFCYHSGVLKDILSGLVDLIYPPLCLSCKKKLTAFSGLPVLCAECLASIQPNLPPFCPKCSRSLQDDPYQVKCRACRKHPPYFDFAWSACVYTDPLRQLIRWFKFNDKTALRHVFAQLMIDHILHYNLDIYQFDYLLPIPLCPVRERERGYNQASLLASLLSARFHIPILRQGLFRRYFNSPQSLLSEKERFTNIQGAFTIKSSLNIKNHNILIIDDLLTTGATASEAACTLKNAGAERVGVFTLAITL